MSPVRTRTLIRRASTYTGGFVAYFVLALLGLIFFILAWDHFVNPEKSPLSYTEAQAIGLRIFLPCLLSYALILLAAPRLPRWAMLPLALGSYFVTLPLGFMLFMLFMLVAGNKHDAGEVLHGTLEIYYSYLPLLIPMVLLALAMKVRPARMPKERRRFTQRPKQQP